MDENTIIEELEELIKSFRVQIRNEAIKQLKGRGVFGDGEGCQ
jgi:hypothetical protein